MTPIMMNDTNSVNEIATSAPRFAYESALP